MASVGSTSSSPVAAILAAGGRGDRARDPLDPRPKQFLSVCGRPLWRWSFEILARVCDPVIVVVPESFVGDVAEQGVTCIAGGASRQASVAAGLTLVDTDRVVVHDAARPLVTEVLLRRVVDALDPAEGATAAVELHDTLVRVENDGVVEIVDRAGLWRIQTPQAFRTASLRDAHARALEEGITTASDDSQLLVRAGRRVAVVDSDDGNLKVTDAADFVRVEASLGTRA